MQQFDLPRLAWPIADVMGGVDVELSPQKPLPDLSEPDLPPLRGPLDEELVPVVHRRVRALGVYWHGGWAHAQPGCWLRPEVMARLGAVADALPGRWGLAVFDAWRSLELQAELFEAAYGHPGVPSGFVSDPDPDPTAPPPHLTGGAVDLTLTLDGIPLELGCGFDDFTDDAWTDSLEAAPCLAAEARRFLYWRMRAEGFVVLDREWWHFEYGTRRWAGLGDDAPRYGPAAPPS